VISELCVFDMAMPYRRPIFVAWDRKQAFGHGKAMKNKESAPLLFALIWACLRAFGPIFSLECTPKLRHGN